MYRQNLVVAIKVNGKVLREDEGRVSLPFGSEYSILIKNLDSVRIQFNIEVDGVNACQYGDRRMILRPNDSADIERYVRDGNLTSGNRFKFIEQTADIEEHRGVGLDDGLVRVEAWRERIAEQPAYYPESRSYPEPRYYRPTPAPLRPSVYRRPGVKYAANYGHPQSRGSMSRPTVPPRPDLRASLGRPGITVPGSASAQSFGLSSNFPLEPESIVMVLHLMGMIGDVPIAEAITVDHSPICSTCGKTNKQKNSFCFACGTSLMLV